MGTLMYLHCSDKFRCAPPPHWWYSNYHRPIDWLWSLSLLLLVEANNQNDSPLLFRNGFGLQTTPGSEAGHSDGEGDTQDGDWPIDFPSESVSRKIWKKLDSYGNLFCAERRPLARSGKSGSVLASVIGWRLLKFSSNFTKQLVSTGEFLDILELSRHRTGSVLDHPRSSLDIFLGSVEVVCCIIHPSSLLSFGFDPNLLHFSNFPHNFWADLVASRLLESTRTPRINCSIHYSNLL